MYINILSTSSARGEEWRKTDSLYDTIQDLWRLVNLRVGVIPFNEKCASFSPPWSGAKEFSSDVGDKISRLKLTAVWFS